MDGSGGRDGCVIRYGFATGARCEARETPGLGRVPHLPSRIEAIEKVDREREGHEKPDYFTTIDLSIFATALLVFPNTDVPMVINAG